MHVHSLSSALALSLYLASSYAASIDHSKRADLTITTNLPTDWGYVGCFNDSIYNRDLHPEIYRDDAMTQEKCVQHCISAGYWFAGVEYAKECYCGFKIRTGGGTQAFKMPESQCNMACGGDAKEKCGGPALINIFSNKQPPPLVNPGVNGFTSLGCKYDAGGGYRTLTTPMSISDGPNGMTVAKCTAACANGGFIYAGVEYASECYCGNQLTQGDDTPDPDNRRGDGCDMPCKGNQSEWCGGQNSLNMYKSSITPGKPTQIPAGWYYQNCYSDDTKTRSLEKLLNLPTSTMTVETCINACASRNYVFAGLEYGQECWCGNQLGNFAAERYDGCNMACQGNTAQTCGGQNRLSLYHKASSSAASVIGNGGFEDGSPGVTYWGSEYSFEGTSNLQVGYETDTGHAIGGHRNAYTYSTGSSTMQNRGICFVQYISPLTYGYYNLTFFVGRSHTPGSGNGETYDTIRYAVGLGENNPGNFPTLCSPPSSCTYKPAGGNGQVGYEKAQYFLAAGGQNARLSICAHYYGTPRANEDRMVLDEVSLIGPL